jgi:hypothetical protein
MKSICFYLLMMIPVFSCKKTPPTSDLQTLDNLAGSKTEYECRGSYPLSLKNRAQLGDPQYAASAESALTALSPDLQVGIFDQLGTTVVYSKQDIGTACKQSPAEAGSPESLRSCYVMQGDKPVIHVLVFDDAQKSKKNIEHAMLRSALAVFSDTILEAPDNKTPPLAETKSDLTRAFLADLATMNKLNALPDQLPADLKSADTNKRDQALKSQASNESVKQLVSNVVVDSLHSYLCSSSPNDATSSRAVFERDFKATWAVFSQTFALDLGGAQESFGLWGRWGYGNGPLRQGLSNWGSYRSAGGGLFNARRFSNGGGFVFQRPWFNPWRWGT